MIVLARFVSSQEVRVGMKRGVVGARRELEKCMEVGDGVAKLRYST
jgi:hypothetical protein